MIQDLYLTVQGYGQKFHQYDRNMRRSPGGTPEGKKSRSQVLAHNALQGVYSKRRAAESAGYSPRLRTSRGNTAAGTVKPARYLPQEVPHGL
ncbi:hypothetical protein ROTMU0001_1067 [Rothia mucilaginosa ATCC 25296]|nr:hypothetical protein ROTMU0001_1067 [Rothia mucilaginosa ATCC 25296]